MKTEPSSDHMIEIVFHPEMTVTSSRLEFSPLMILTTLGGHIGVCRTVLWIGMSLAGLKKCWQKIDFLFN